LLAYYILWLLRQKLNSVRRDPDKNVEERHWLASNLCQLFEGCGEPGDVVMYSLNRLYDRRLIETLDPNSKQVSVADKIAIKDSGLAHFDLALNSTVYVEQMALVTGLSELSARDEIKMSLQKGDFHNLREAFVRYVLKIDSGRLGIPPSALYSQIELARRQIEVLTAAGRKKRATAAAT
jgi:hypothetical protein